ncbi:MAG: hypothetical protein A4S09_01580 [Proteobacteria bacterium SG_bin7]|nr:MAG: hypothetical protein A4S09_01580 [Proteobacteria bacterium SG_bin7]
MKKLLLFILFGATSANALDINLCAHLTNLKVANRVLELNGCIGNQNDHLSPQNPQNPQNYPPHNSYDSNVCVLDTTDRVEEFIYLRHNDVETGNPLSRLSNGAKIVDLQKKKKDKWGHEHTKIRVIENVYTEGQLSLAPNGATGWILTGVLKCY